MEETIRFTHETKGDQTFRFRNGDLEAYDNFLQAVSRTHDRDPSNLRLRYEFEGRTEPIDDERDFDAFLENAESSYDIITIQVEHREQQQRVGPFLGGHQGYQQPQQVHQQSHHQQGYRQVYQQTSPHAAQQPAPQPNVVTSHNHQVPHIPDPEPKPIIINVPPNIYDPQAHDGPLDLDNVIKLILESKEAAKELEGKDAVLLLGPTGVGKTTTINWILNGKPLQERRAVMEMKDGSKLDQTVWVPEKSFQGFDVGHSAVDSSTTTCRAIEDEQLGLHLCDAPGMFDSSGPAVDIANAVGVVNVLRVCKSVRFLVLIDGAALRSGRSSSIKGLMDVLVRFMGTDRFENSNNPFEGFTFLFTRDSPLHEILSVVKQLWNNQPENSPLAKLYSTILKALNVHKNKLNINQSIHRPDSVRELLKESKPYQAHEFHSPLTREDIDKLNFACETKKSLIQELLRPRANKKIDYQDVALQLGIIANLKEEIPEPFIEEALHQVAELTKSHLEDVLKQAKSCFSEEWFEPLSSELENLRQSESYLSKLPAVFEEWGERFFETVADFRKEINTHVCHVANSATGENTPLNVVCKALDYLRDIRKYISLVLTSDTVKIMDGSVKAVRDRVLGVQGRVQLAVKSLFQAKHEAKNSDSNDGMLEGFLSQLDVDLVLLREAKVLKEHLQALIPNVQELYDVERKQIISRVSALKKDTEQVVSTLRKDVEQVVPDVRSTASNSSVSSMSAVDEKEVAAAPNKQSRNGNVLKLKLPLQILKVVCEHEKLRAHLDVETQNSFNVALGFVQSLGDDLFATIDKLFVKKQFNLLVVSVQLCLWLSDLNSNIHTLLREKTTKRLNLVLDRIKKLFEDCKSILEQSKQADESTSHLFPKFSKSARTISDAIPLDTFMVQPVQQVYGQPGTQILEMYQELVQQLSNRFKEVVQSCSEALDKGSDRNIQQTLLELGKMHHVQDFFGEEDKKELVAMLSSVRLRVQKLSQQVDLLAPGKTKTGPPQSINRPSSKHKNKKKQQKQQREEKDCVPSDQARPRTGWGSGTGILNRLGFSKSKSSHANSIYTEEEKEFRHEDDNANDLAGQTEVPLDTLSGCVRERSVLMAATKQLLDMNFEKVIPEWRRNADQSDELRSIGAKLGRVVQFEAQRKRDQFKKLSEELNFRAMIKVLEWFTSAAKIFEKQLEQEALDKLDDKDLRQACRERVTKLVDDCTSAVDRNDYGAATQFLDNLGDASVLQAYTQGLDVSSECQRLGAYLNGKKSTVVDSIARDLTRHRFENVARNLKSIKHSQKKDFSSKKEFEDCDDSVYEFLQQNFDQIIGFSFDITNFSLPSLQKLASQISTFTEAKCLQGIATFDVEKALKQGEEVLQGFFQRFNKSCIGNLRRRRYVLASKQWNCIQQFLDPRLNLSEGISERISKKIRALRGEIDNIEEKLRIDYASALCVIRLPRPPLPRTKSSEAKHAQVGQEDFQPTNGPRLAPDLNPDPEEAESIMHACKDAADNDAFLDDGDQPLSIDFSKVYRRLTEDTKEYFAMIGNKTRSCLEQKNLAGAREGIEALQDLASVSDRHRHFVYEFQRLDQLKADLEASKNAFGSTLAPTLTVQSAQNVLSGIANTFKTDGVVACNEAIGRLLKIFDSQASENGQNIFTVDLLGCKKRHLQSISNLLEVWDAYKKECMQYGELFIPLKDHIRQNYYDKYTRLLWESIETLMKSINNQAISRCTSVLASLRLILSVFNATSLPPNCYKELGNCINKAESAMSDQEKRFDQARLFIQSIDLAKELDVTAFNTHMQVIRQQKDFDVNTVVAQHAEDTAVVAAKSLQSQNYDPVYHLMDNIEKIQQKAIQQKATDPDLDATFTRVKEKLNQEVKQRIEHFHERAISAIDQDKISELEPIWREIDNMEKKLSKIFISLFKGGSLSDELETKVHDKIKQFIKKFDYDKPPIDDVADLLIKLQHFVREISKDTMKQKIREDMYNFLKKVDRSKEWNFFALGQLLKNNGPVGREIVRNVPIFEANRLQYFQGASSKISVSDAIKSMQCDEWAEINGNLDATALKDLYGIFEERYRKLTKEFLFENRNEELVEKVKKDAAKLSGSKSSEWANIRKELTVLLAGVFAAWSVTKSASLYDKKPRDTPVFYEPHSVQVLTVFRLLGLDETASALSKYGTKLGLMAQRMKNHLCQVSTGCGKSVILGTLATFLALIGFDVRCACYSKYLSKRDEKDFEALWTSFGVKKQIEYSTLDGLVEDAINRKGDIRGMTNAIVNGNNIGMISGKKTAPTVLLIDEVDVFLTERFFGNSFHPVTTYASASLTAIVEYVWKNHGQPGFGAQAIQGLPEYQKLKRELTAIPGFVDQCLQNMLRAVGSYRSHEYKLTNQDGTVRIGYLDAGGDISTTTNHGFKTVFAYLYERDNPSSGPTGPVTAETAAQNVHVNISCGYYSYAEIPKSSQFQAILGVTGTLKTLGNYEKDVLKTVYNIKHQTITPSIYGPSRLTFKSAEDVYVCMNREGEDGWTQKINGEILDKVEKRSVMVFFESEEKMDLFVNSQQGQQLMRRSPKPELVKSGSDRISHFVETAPLKGRVTLFDRIWGRGLDFICDDDDVKDAGGVHVIQTFFSEDLSEEVQIKGRTARSRDKGSYQLILCAEDLHKFGIANQMLVELKKGTTLYDELCGLRTKKKDELTARRQKQLKKAERAHNSAMHYVDALRENPINVKEVRKLLQNLQ